MIGKNTKVVIVEDEIPASDRLIRLLKKYSDDFEVVTTLDSVTGAVSFFNTNPDYDLIFMDIQLGDGISLEIFEKTTIHKPIVFVTAYDDYALKAFKVNSIDYLLKPIDADDLAHAMQQYQKHKDNYHPGKVEKLYDQIAKSKKKERFLVKKGNGLRIITIDQVAYFYSEDGYLHIMDKQGQKHIIDNTLESLYQELDHSVFFKINRKTIVSISSIVKIDNYFNSRLILQLNPSCPHQVIVAREKCKEFKMWLS